MSTQTFIPTLIVILVLAIVVERTGLLNFLLEKIGKIGYWAIKWLFAIEGSWGSLAHKLAYRDFYDDIVETKNGWFWVGVEIIPFPTDGLSNKDKNRLTVSINNFYTILPPNTKIQQICKIDTDASMANTVFNRIAKSNLKNVFAPLQIARRNYLLKAGHKGQIKTTKTYIFFGREASEVAIESTFLRSAITSIKSLYNPKPFLDIERAEFIRVKEELSRIRETFINNYNSVWGTDDVVRKVSSAEIYHLAWTSLNPELAQSHPSPSYPSQKDKNKPSSSNNGYGNNNGYGSNNSHGNNNGHSNKSTTDSNLNSNLTPNPNLSPNPYEDEELENFPTLLKDNARQSLCETDIKVEKDYLLFNDKFCMTVSLAKHPTTANGLMTENLYRDSQISFPITISSHYHTSDKNHINHRLAKKQNRLRAAMRRSTTNPDTVEDLQNDQYSALIRLLNTQNLAIGELGFSVSFLADSKSELYRRRDLVISAIQSMNGCRVTPERHCALNLHLTTLPCTPHGIAGDSTGDFRRRLSLSREAVAFSPWTSSPKGVSPIEAFDIFQGREGNLLPWGTDPRNRRFRNGMAAIIGKSGSGKSAFLNKLRISWLSSGRVGVSIDYQNSARRVARAVDGLVIDVSKPNLRGLGLFAIRPRANEYFEASELTEEGLPKDRVLAVNEMLEIFCLDDPTKPQESRLDPEMIAVLNKAVLKTYARLLRETPIIDDFIATLRKLPGQDGELGRKLAARLELFAKNSGLGHWLNDRSEPLPINGYVVFDFGYVNNARLKLVAAMALVMYLERFIHANPTIAKFLDIDELGEICKEPILARIIDRLVRTARKKNAVVTVSSQDPRDFDTNKELRGIMSSCEIKYIFELVDAELAAKTLKLTPGQYKAIKTLKPATKDFSEFLLTYPSAAPGGGSAVIRMKYCPAEARLVAGAGFELATYEEALADVQASKLPIHPSLNAAFQTTALVGTDREILAKAAS